MSFVLEYENAHCHSYYQNPLVGFGDSPTSIEDYAKEYANRNMQCLVMQEHGNRSDVWAQADIAYKYQSENFTMKPICAAEVYFVPDRNPELKDARNFHLLLIAKNNEGFEELNFALQQAQETGFYKHARLDYDLLQKLNYKNFLCTTACVGGILKDNNGEQMACILKEIFRENFRLEVQYHNNQKQALHNLNVLRMYAKHKWPLFFATDSHYIRKEDKILRTELIMSRSKNATSQNQEDKKNSNLITLAEDSDFDLYLPTAEEAYKLMVSQGVLSKAQIEEAFENTLELRTFEGFSYNTERKLPISKPRQNMTQEERNYLYQKMVCDGYIKSAGMPTDEEKKALRDEMDIIVDTNTADYFISLKDMLDRGVELGGVLTTTARGSAGSFASNFALGLIFQLCAVVKLRKNMVNL